MLCACLAALQRRALVCELGGGASCMPCALAARVVGSGIACVGLVCARLWCVIDRSMHIHAKSPPPLDSPHVR